MHFNLVAVVVRAQDLVNIDDLDLLLDRQLHARQEGRSVNGLHQDPLILVGADRVLQIGDLDGVGALRVEHRHVHVTGRQGDGFSGGKHRRVVAVGDPVRQVGNVVRLHLVLRGGLRTGHNAKSN